ncbi:hypothetical protein [Bradyrhizobium sp. LA2.1]|uniref:hypothetical protein n=1 Tax=Bradyrhizobium sp. LA2.1 TaxID=3156376 RepID=UPI0033967FFC
MIFAGACAGCHAWNGSGALVSAAELTGSRAINDPSAINIVQMTFRHGASSGRTAIRAKIRRRLNRRRDRQPSRTM